MNWNNNDLVLDIVKRDGHLLENESKEPLKCVVIKETDVEKILKELEKAKEL